MLRIDGCEKPVGEVKSQPALRHRWRSIYWPELIGSTFRPCPRRMFIQNECQHVLRTVHACTYRHHWQPPGLRVRDSAPGATFDSDTAHANKFYFRPFLFFFIYCFNKSFEYAICSLNSFGSGRAVGAKSLEITENPLARASRAQFSFYRIYAIPHRHGTRTVRTPPGHSAIAMGPPRYVNMQCIQTTQ